MSLHFSVKRWNWRWFASCDERLSAN